MAIFVNDALRHFNLISVCCLQMMHSRQSKNLRWALGSGVENPIETHGSFIFWR